MADEEDTEHQSGLLIILETRVDEVPTTSSSSVKAVPAMRGVLLLPGTGACSVRRGSETVSPHHGRVSLTGTPLGQRRTN